MTASDGQIGVIQIHFSVPTGIEFGDGGISTRGIKFAPIQRHFIRFEIRYILAHLDLTAVLDGGVIDEAVARHIPLCPIGNIQFHAVYFSKAADRIPIHINITIENGVRVIQIDRDVRIDLGARSRSIVIEKDIAVDFYRFIPVFIDGNR